MTNTPDSDLSYISKVYKVIAKEAWSIISPFAGVITEIKETEVGFRVYIKPDGSDKIKHFVEVHSLNVIVGQHILSDHFIGYKFRKRK